jgi:hypothetical protein
MSSTQTLNTAALSAGATIAASTSEKQAPIAVDAATFKAEFNRHAFTIRHRLVSNSLFSIPRLIELSKQLPDESVKYNSGGIPVGTGIYEAPQTGLSKEDTLLRIGECQSWMVLKNVEQVPEYSALLDQCLDIAEPHCREAGYGMFKREAFIFVSSPASVTPFHIDPEHNFLLQIAGTKTIRILDRIGHSVLTEEEFEDFFTNSHYSPVFKDEYKELASRFTLNPGDGLHFPVTTPHWVENGDQVSVSFSITFRSLQAERRGLVYEVNHRLRRLGIKPVPYGDSALRDSAKYFAFRAVRRTGNLVGRFRGENDRY